ncbi:G1 family glutamic endopeptidase [Streptomyces sp. NRRL F-5126]|uniref:G1 family glutamic endopeptidase n=1 Tax=Streptomyces sp. NRRL F-5126 TaxID=1463857 RepID=UPI0004CC39C6|nr:G1 family glutamic endopeptidase [Streptomyces sp. NRRL F-5126]
MSSHVSTRRKSLRALSVGAAVVSVAGLSMAGANAAPQNPAQLNSSIASHESHALHGARGHNTTTEASNWSGYAATGGSGAYKSVSSSWVQPAVSCTSQNTYSSFWVGIDGYSQSDNGLEQTGTEADCINGRATYGAWWEVLPAAESAYSVTVKPGDHLKATVTNDGNGQYTMTLADSTEGWTKTTHHAGSQGVNGSSAEVIAEATQVNGQIAALSNFGTVNFSGSTANGSTLPGSSDEIVMENFDTGSVKAQPSALSAGAFSDTWRNYN